jgi:hypothetical protein
MEEQGTKLTFKFQGRHHRLTQSARAFLLINWLLTARARPESSPDRELDVLANGANRAVHQKGIDQSKMTAAGSHGRIVLPCGLPAMRQNPEGEKGTVWISPDRA